MSVHQESLDMRPVERVQDAPSVEYNAVRNDSLTMFGAAIGGAILGMLLTLLVLAVINGGTLSFSGGERLDALEASVARIDENVGAVSYNVDMVAKQAQAMQTQMATLEGQMNTNMTTVNTNMDAMQKSIDSLNQSATQFTTFLDTLRTALKEAADAASGSTTGQ
jgi:uncharacterized protein YoxC